MAHGCSKVEGDATGGQSRRVVGWSLPTVKAFAALAKFTCHPVNSWRPDERLEPSHSERHFAAGKQLVPIPAVPLNDLSNPVLQSL
jgi:hypothetical protein